MKKAKLFKKLNNNKIKCLACNHYCQIEDLKTGICGVRKNIKGELYLLVYGKAAAVNLDPIEKKPLFHFLPGEFAFSFGTFGCNFGCDFCQNWDISQKFKIQKSKLKIKNNIYLKRRGAEPYYGEEWEPERIVEYCLENKIRIIAYTYNEPTIWTEYAFKTMKLAKKEGIKNVWVTNGFMSRETLSLIADYLDAINVDLKSFSPDFYLKISKGRIEPVKENIKRIFELGIWEEVTTLIIPGYNDSEKELKKIAQFLYNISPNLVWHISAFYPAYKMLDVPPTSFQTLNKAYKIGKEIGLNYVYTGNIPNEDLESTFCPQCGERLIKRRGIEMIENKLKEGKCPNCGFSIAGRWK